MRQKIIEIARLHGATKMHNEILLILIENQKNGKIQYLLSELTTLLKNAQVSAEEKLKDDL